MAMTMKLSNHGFSLVELMVSLALGSVLLAGISSMYLSARQNQNQDQELANL